MKITNLFSLEVKLGEHGPNMALAWSQKLEIPWTCHIHQVDPIFNIVELPLSLGEGVAGKGAKTRIGWSLHGPNIALS